MSTPPAHHAQHTEPPPVLHAVPPPQQEPSPVSLLLKYGPDLAKGAGLLVAGVLAWNALGARVDRLEEKQARMVLEVQGMQDENRQRFDELNRQREQHAKDLALLNLRIDTLEKSQQRTEQNTVLLLERVGRSQR